MRRNSAPPSTSSKRLLGICHLCVKHR
jgi:hypothetical protein